MTDDTGNGKASNASAPPSALTTSGAPVDVAYGRKERAVSAGDLPAESPDRPERRAAPPAGDMDADPGQLDAAPSAGSITSAAVRPGSTLAPLASSAREEIIQQYHPVLDRLTSEERQAVDEYYRHLRDIQ